MATLRLPPELENRLNTLAIETHRTKSYYMTRALEDYLEEHEDYLLALSVSERIKTGKERTYTLEEIKKKHGLLDV